MLGRELVKRDIIAPLDFFMRDHEPRLRSWVLIADGRAESIIMTKGIMHPLPAVEIDETMKSGKSIGKYPMVQLFDLIRMMSHKDKAGYLPRIRVMEIVGKDAWISALITLRGLESFIATVFMPETPYWALGGSFLLLVAWSMYRNIESIARVALILLVIIIPYRSHNRYQPDAGETVPSPASHVG